MPVLEPGCCDGPNELLRKILLSLPSINTGGGGSTVCGFTPGSVIFAGADGCLNQDNPSFFYNNTSNFLGVGTSQPQEAIDIFDGYLRVSNYGPAAGSSAGIYLYRSQGGSMGAEVAPGAGVGVGFIEFAGYRGDATLGFGALINAVTDTAWTTTNTSAHLDTYTTPVGSNISIFRMRVASNGNVGINTASPTSLLHIAGPIATAISTKIAAYPIVATDSTILANAAAAGFTVTLPTPVGITGRQYRVKKIDATANVVTVATAAGLIDGAATQPLVVQWQSMDFQSDGANWFIV